MIKDRDNDFIDPRTMNIHILPILLLKQVIFVFDCKISLQGKDLMNELRHGMTSMVIALPNDIMN